MNIQSNQKKNSIYLLVLFTLVSLFVFSSCGGKEDTPEKLDYATLISGEYEGTLTVGENLNFVSNATLSKGSTETEMIFTEKLKKADETDSTTTFKIELRDLNSSKAIALRIPQQTIQGVTIVGIALDETDPQGIQGYFFYQDEEGEKLNDITFLITANNGNYYYNYSKVE
ncbi:hypothetical protein ACE193_01730 [Bernardetia sp. OM2101]|uniref:hypothetical protein n=1 Tax=Bernardetia sp. OM2101 TaxID=3344876 RepID=UPI0035D0BFF0